MYRSTRRTASSLTAAEKFALAYVRALCSKFRMDILVKGETQSYSFADEPGSFAVGISDDSEFLFYLEASTIGVQITYQGYGEDQRFGGFRLTLDFAKDAAKIAAAV